MNSTNIKGHLQIDHERGVIYFHSDPDEMDIGRCPTPLRICGMGNIIYPLNDIQIDMTIRPIGIQGRTINEILVTKE